MTNGAPTDQTHQAVARDVSARVRDRKLTIFPIAIGAAADMATLALFSPARPPLRLQGLNFGAFFAWLAKSVAATSVSTPGEVVKLDVDGLRGWAEL